MDFSLIECMDKTNLILLPSYLDLKNPEIVTLRNLTQDSSGVYRCTASNDVGEENCIIEVTMQCKFSSGQPSVGYQCCDYNTLIWDQSVVALQAWRCCFSVMDRDGFNTAQLFISVFLSIFCLSLLFFSLI